MVKGDRIALVAALQAAALALKARRRTMGNHLRRTVMQRLHARQAGETEKLLEKALVPVFKRQVAGMVGELRKVSGKSIEGLLAKEGVGRCATNEQGGGTAGMKLGGRDALNSKSVDELLLKEKLVEKYDPNQPRDELGRWVDEGGDLVRMVGAEHNPAYRPMSESEKLEAAERSLAYSDAFANRTPVIDDEGRKRTIRTSMSRRLDDGTAILVDRHGNVYRQGPDDARASRVPDDELEALKREMGEYADRVRRELHESLHKFDKPAESLARRIASETGLSVSLHHPSDSSSRYIYVDMPAGGQFKIRIADHPQPLGWTGEGIGPVGGFDTSVGARHSAADVSIDPSSGKTEDDAIALLARILEAGGKGREHKQYRGTKSTPQIARSLVRSSFDPKRWRDEILGAVAPVLAKQMLESATAELLASGIEPRRSKMFRITRPEAKAMAVSLADLAKKFNQLLPALAVEVERIATKKGSSSVQEGRWVTTEEGNRLFLSPNDELLTGPSGRAIGGRRGTGFVAARYDKKQRRWFIGRKPVPKYVGRIPPDWRNVTVSLDPKADVLAKGFDKKGRDQTLYSKSHHIRAAAVKFAKVNELRKKLERIKREVADDLKNGDESTRENAACLRLVCHTGLRPGSNRDTKADVKAYGATTLEGRHVKITKEGVRLRFVGKKGVKLDIPVTDKAIAADLIKRAKAAGPRGRLFDTTGSRLLRYSRSKDGGGFRTKDFRTAVGTSEAITVVRKMKSPKCDEEYKQQVKAVARAVAAKLGNTPSVALQSYIDPNVFAKWRVKAGR